MAAAETVNDQEPHVADTTNTHPVPSEPNRTSRKWNFSTSAVIIMILLLVVCLFVLSLSRCPSVFVVVVVVLV